jgi:23S rRNA (uracil1939-C5)-methyltransferase
LKLSIEKLIYGGDGLARLPADESDRRKPVFVPFVLENEVIEARIAEAKHGFARGQVEAIIQSSPDRIAAKCPYFQRCGGCHYQHGAYSHQLQTKAAILKENLLRIAKHELQVELEIHSGPEWNYRNRSRLKVQHTPEFGLGYYQHNSHVLLAVEECPINSRLINDGIRKLGQGTLGAGLAELEEIEFFADAEDKHLLIEAHCGLKVGRSNARQWAEKLRQSMPEVRGVSVYRRAATGHDDPGQPEGLFTAGAGELLYQCSGVSYRVSAGAFFQTNRFLVDELVRLVAGRKAPLLAKNARNEAPEAEPGQLALDLYAGGGLFSRTLAARFAQVVAVESSPISHADLLYNSLPNVTARRATVEQYLLDAGKNLRPDLVVVDPPRGGLGGNVVAALTTMGASQLTYVSCDPATLSRDLAGLLQGGYRVRQAHMVDLFPQTYHIESVFHLAR